MINVMVPYTGVPGSLFTLIPAADWFVTADTGRTAVGRVTALEISGKQFGSAARAGALADIFLLIRLLGPCTGCTNRHGSDGAGRGSLRQS